MTLKSHSITMEGVCALRAEYSDRLGDNYSKKLLHHMPNSVKSKKMLDETSKGMFSRGVLLRELFFRSLLKYHSENIGQLIILSAGLDLSVLDFKEWRGKIVFSVDHPYSQTFLQEICEVAGVDLSIYRFIPYDLTQDLTQLFRLLETNGLDRSLPTLITWQGATYYFSPEDIVRIIGSFPEYLDNLWFVCDCMNKDGYLKQRTPTITEHLSFLENIGEPWKGFLDLDKFNKKITEVGYEEHDLISRDRLEEELTGQVKKNLNHQHFFSLAKKGTFLGYGVSAT